MLCETFTKAMGMLIQHTSQSKLAGKRLFSLRLEQSYYGIPIISLCLHLKITMKNAKLYRILSFFHLM